MAKRKPAIDLEVVEPLPERGSTAFFFAFLVAAAAQAPKRRRKRNHLTRPAQPTYHPR